MIDVSRPFSIWAVVPARGGSKRFIDKNLANFNRKSLVLNTLEKLETLEDYIFKIVLSSDSLKILDQGKNLKSCVLHRRIDSALDTSTADEVIVELLESELSTANFENDWIIYCQPTSPLVTSRQYKEVIELGLKSRKNVVSIMEKPISLEKIFRLDEFGYVFISESNMHPTMNSQMAKDIVYLPNGAIYFFRIKDFLVKNTFPISGSLPYPMSWIDSIDVDNEKDLLAAKRVIHEQI